MAKKKVVKTETSPEQAMDELVKVSQELFPEQYEPVSSDEPTEAVQEESTETKADVPETDNIAVIASEEGTQDVPEVTEGITEEALIDLTPVGAEVIEDVLANTPTPEELAESFKPSETGEGDSAGDFDPEYPPEGFVESDEDGDGVPEHYVFDWANQPVAATLIHIRETKINSLVEKVLFASYLGGELYKNGVQLNRVPFRANVLIPTAKVGQFLSGEGKLEHEEDFNYTQVTVKGVSAHLFLKRLMAVSKKGAVITPLKKAVNNSGFLVSLQCKAPVAQSPSFQLSAHKPKYSVDELKELSAESLRIICGWYNIPYKGKVQSRIDIKMKQDEK